MKYSAIDNGITQFLSLEPLGVAGALSGTGLNMNMVDYVPCYRTEAGNGCAMGFAEWT